jgi:hypothetical protein
MDPAEAQHPGEREAGRDEQREHGRQLRSLRAAGDNKRQDRRGDEGRGRALRPDDELPRRAEEHVRHRRKQQRIEAIHGR